MLFASLQSERVSTFAFHIQSSAHYAAWHLTGKIYLGAK
jgi:hypothetical protein